MSTRVEVASKTFTRIIGFLALTTFIFVAVSAIIPVNMESVKPDWPAPSEATNLTSKMESKGMTCNSTPVLTDTIVVSDKAGARVVTFDAALAASKAKTATVEAYCTKK